MPGSDGVPDDLDMRFAENYGRIGGGREFNWPAQVWGQPEREQWMGIFNAELPLSSGSTLYAFGNYSRRDQSGGFFYRRPGVSQLLPVRLSDGSIYRSARIPLSLGLHTAVLGQGHGRRPCLRRAWRASHPLELQSFRTLREEQDRLQHRQHDESFTWARHTHKIPPRGSEQ